MVCHGLSRPMDVVPGMGGPGQGWGPSFLPEPQFKSYRVKRHGETVCHEAFRKPIERSDLAEPGSIMNIVFFDQCRQQRRRMIPLSHLLIELVSTGVTISGIDARTHTFTQKKHCSPLDEIHHGKVALIGRTSLTNVWTTKKRTPYRCIQHYVQNPHLFGRWPGSECTWNCKWHLRAMYVALLHVADTAGPILENTSSR